MKNLKSFIITSLAIVLLASCSKDDCISGSGGYVSRDYNTASFNALSISGDAEVYITNDATRSVRIEGQNNILNALNVEVKGQTLTIGEDNCFRDASRLKVYISTPTLIGLTSAGYVNVTSADTFTENVFSVVLSGSGSMNFNYNVQEFNASISGSGDISASGTATKQYFISSGDGDFNCFNLVGEDVDINVSGTANLEVHATKTLNIDVSGTANIYYKGNPLITQKISGTATIVDAN
jgi:FlaG/FlaF family flagellin (archaellin)